MTDEMQLIFNIAIGLSGVLGGWVLKRIFTVLDRLENDSRNMPLYYVTKADYKDDLIEIKALLHRLLDKIDQKVDK